MSSRLFVERRLARPWVLLLVSLLMGVSQGTMLLAGAPAVALANAWRTTPDIDNTFESFMERAIANDATTLHRRPGAASGSGRAASGITARGHYRLHRWRVF